MGFVFELWTEFQYCNQIDLLCPRGIRMNAVNVLIIMCYYKHAVV